MKINIPSGIHGHTPRFIQRYAGGISIAARDRLRTGKSNRCPVSRHRSDHSVGDSADSFGTSVGEINAASRINCEANSTNGGAGCQRRLGQALIRGGWLPLGAPYKEMARMADSIADRAAHPKIIRTYYDGLESWPEREGVSKLSVHE